jgi:hypothetical protein
LSNYYCVAYDLKDGNISLLHTSPAKTQPYAVTASIAYKTVQLFQGAGLNPGFAPDMSITPYANLMALWH